MASKKPGDLSLEETPTWAVAVVCFVLIAISIAIEHLLHIFGEWLKKKNKNALFEALEKVKAELMLMGFISLLLVVGQGPISQICIPKSVASTWHPCTKKQESLKTKTYKNIDIDSGGYYHRRRLFSFLDSDETYRRVLAGDKYGPTCKQGRVPFVSTYGIHQLHIFIFVLAITHVIYCISTLAFGRLKMRKWKAWEMETKSTEYQFSHDPERFRFARDTSFGRRHLSYWSTTPVLLWIVCFFRQFVRSVPKVDYSTLRHGFILAHLAPQSQTNFDFHKYIKRSLEEDFKVVVGISPTIWMMAILFLLFNTHGWYSYFWLPFIPLIIILLVGTKLQVIITKMGLRIQDRGEVVKGTPVVQPGDDLFWFNRPRLLLFLIHFVLFQNAFQVAFFLWAWYEFGLRSCFHEHVEDIVIRLSMGVLIQILCSYVTLPLYALVTQMGTSMKPTIFDDKVAKALHNWHQSAKKHIKKAHQSGSVTPMSSRPGTPLHGSSPSPFHSSGMSPVHLLRNYKNEHDSTSFQTSPRLTKLGKAETWDGQGSASPSRHPVGDDIPWSKHRGNHELEEDREVQPIQEPSSSQSAPQALHVEHAIDIGSSNFTFDKRSGI